MRAPGNDFTAYGWDHLAVLALSAVIVVTMCRVERSGRFPRVAKAQRFALAALMILVFPLSLLAEAHLGNPLRAGEALPMHLCDWAAITAFIALIWKRPLIAELTYFWGLAGTLQGLATPDVAHGFPHPAFLVFFLHHGGVVIASIYIAAGMCLRPRRGSVLRVFLWTQFYVVVAVLINGLLGTNYGYLSAKPVNASALDFFGEWPWYILVMEGVCLGLLLLFDLPFALGRRRKRGRAAE